MADEFLVHISRDGYYIEGLHPVRSRHIVEYLHEYYPLEETAYNITKLADLQDFSVLFSHYRLIRKVFIRMWLMNGGTLKI